MRYQYNKHLIVFTFIAFYLCSCKKLVEVDPPVTNPSSSSIYQSDATAIAVLTGLYSKIQAYGFPSGQYSITTLTALSSDELKNWSFDVLLSQSYTNGLRSNSGVPFWRDLYSSIYITNAAIEGINNSNSLSQNVRNQLLGEAKFMRAFFYFYLINLYGDVPLIVTTDFRTNSNVSKSTIANVYAQIIIDLKEAQNSLNENYVGLDATTATTEKVRPNKSAATSLLSRVYLYIGDWTNAEVEATKVISNTKYKLAVDVNSVFLKNSLEAIWQLQPNSPQTNTFDALTYILNDVPGNSYYFSLSNTLVKSFEPSDARKTSWVGKFVSGTDTFYFPYKYKVLTPPPATEYLMVLRLAELYLIRAESRARLDRIDDAKADLNVIRTRAKLPGTSAVTKEEVLTAIENERKIELFVEWGHRWFDLKRLGHVNAVMSTVTLQKGGIWNPNWQLYPLPIEDILINKNLIQNKDY